jgi:hypothetical protein
VPTASSAGFGVIPTFSVYRAAHKIDVGAHIKVYDVSEDRFGIMGGYYPINGKRHSIFISGITLYFLQAIEVRSFLFK